MDVEDDFNFEDGPIGGGRRRGCCKWRSHDDGKWFGHYWMCETSPTLNGDLECCLCGLFKNKRCALYRVYTLASFLIPVSDIRGCFPYRK